MYNTLITDISRPTDYVLLLLLLLLKSADSLVSALVFLAVRAQLSFFFELIYKALSNIAIRPVVGLMFLHHKRGALFTRIGWIRL